MGSYRTESRPRRVSATGNGMIVTVTPAACAACVKAFSWALSTRGVKRDRSKPRSRESVLIWPPPTGLVP